MVVTHPFRDFVIETYIAFGLIRLGGLVCYMHTERRAHFTRGSSLNIIHQRHGFKHRKEIRILPISILITQIFNSRVQFHQHINAIKQQCAQLVAILGVVPFRFAISTLHFFNRNKNNKIMTQQRAFVCVTWEKILPKGKNHPWWEPVILFACTYVRMCNMVCFSIGAPSFSS